MGRCSYEIKLIDTFNTGTPSAGAYTRVSAARGAALTRTSIQTADRARRISMVL
jgi:hypothetical protein